MTDLPDFFWAERLTPVNFYAYRSTVRDRFFEIEINTDANKEKYETQIRRFHELKKKCLLLDVNISADNTPIWKADLWDNKIVIECETELGNRIFVGFYDWIYTIGLSRDGDKWIKPCPYRELILT